MVALGGEEGEEEKKEATRRLKEKTGSIHLEGVRMYTTDIFLTRN